MSWLVTPVDSRSCASFGADFRAPRMHLDGARCASLELLAKAGRPVILRALMSILIGFLTVIEVIVCLLLILIILMQRPRQEGLGAAFGGGVTDQMFGAQTTNVLQKFTGYLAGALFLLTLVLAVLTTKVQREKVAAGKKLFEAPPPAAAPATPSAPTPAVGAPTSAASAPVAAPASGAAATGKTVSVTKQPGATVVVKQPEAKPAAKADGGKDAKPAAAAPAPKTQLPVVPPASKPANPSAGAPPAAAQKPAESSPAAPAPAPSKP